MSPAASAPISVRLRSMGATAGAHAALDAAEAQGGEHGLHRLIADELVGAGVDHLGHQPHAGVLVEGDEPTDERDPVGERGQERMAHDRPRVQPAPPADRCRR